MKRSAIIIILMSLLAIVVLLSFGTISQGPASADAHVKVNNISGEIVITPTGKKNDLILNQILQIRVITLVNIKVGDDVRDSHHVIFVKEDFMASEGNMSITFKTLWGQKTYDLKLAVDNYVKFYVNGELTDLVSKDEIAALRGFPPGDHTWYSDKNKTTEFDSKNLNDINSLYR